MLGLTTENRLADGAGNEVAVKESSMPQMGTTLMAVSMIWAAMVGGSPVAGAEPVASDIPLGHKNFVPTPERPVGWRGDSTGHFPGADPVTAWDIEKGINILWRVPTKRFSNGMPVVVGQKLFVNMEPRVLLCMDKMTGKLLWAQDGGKEEPLRDADALKTLVVNVPAEGQQPEPPWSQRKLSYGQNAGNSIPTPVTDGKHIWVKNGGGAACYDLDGGRTWMADTHLANTDHPVNVPSPILIGGVLVCEGGITDHWKQNSQNKIADGVIPPNPIKNFKHWLVGLDAATGKVLWDLGPLNAGGYGGPPTPMALKLTDKKETATFVLTAEGHLVRPTDGKLIKPYVGGRAAFASPYQFGQCAIFTHGYISSVQFTLGGPGEADTEPVFNTKCRSGMGGSVVHDGLVYAISCAKEGLYISVVDATTGKLLPGLMLPAELSDKGADWPSCAAAGKYLFMLTDHRVFVLEPGATPKLVAVNAVERTYSGPVFDGERMYLRTHDSVLCIARKGAEGTRYEQDARERARVAATTQKSQ
jgi:outer membrane protein assembly factor BamB